MGPKCRSIGVAGSPRIQSLETLTLASFPFHGAGPGSVNTSSSQISVLGTQKCAALSESTFRKSQFLHYLDREKQNSWAHSLPNDTHILNFFFFFFFSERKHDPSGAWLRTSIQPSGSDAPPLPRAGPALVCDWRGETAEA